MQPKEIAALWQFRDEGRCEFIPLRELQARAATIKLPPPAPPKKLPPPPPPRLP